MVSENLFCTVLWEPNDISWNVTVSFLCHEIVAVKTPGDGSKDFK